jgi:hypothetical protein
MSQAWWHPSRILALGRLRQKDFKYQASLSYIARPCLKTPNKRRVHAGIVLME